MFAGVVLAAGASQRMGSPKALLPIQGEPAVARVARVLFDAGCDEVVVVLGADVDRIREAVPRPARVVNHLGWKSGRSGSLKAGVQALSPTSGILVWPVDHPLAQLSTVVALLAGAGDIRVPVHGGKRGHPTFFHVGLRDELLALRDDQPLHEVVHARPARVVEVRVDDPGILLNLDRPEDAARVAGGSGTPKGGAKRARPPA